MCVIIAAISKRPDLSTIQACHKANPHGIGIAARDGKRVQYLKGLQPDEACDIVKEIAFPFVMHFRLASAGSADDYTLNHPFPISKSAFPVRAGAAESVLFHNGHINDWESKLFHYLNSQGRKFSGAWSDTRLAALVANKFGEDALPALFPSQKFVTFSANSMRFFGAWEKEEGGMVFSNYYWKSTHSSNWQYKPLPGLERNLPARYKKSKGDYLNHDYNDKDFPIGYF